MIVSGASIEAFLTRDAGVFFLTIAHTTGKSKADRSMGSLRSFVETEVQQAFKALGYEASLGSVQNSRRPELGQFQCNGAMSAAKAARVVFV